MFTSAILIYIDNTHDAPLTTESAGTSSCIVNPSSHWTPTIYEGEDEV